MPIDRQPNSPTKFMRMGLCPKCGENSYNTSMDGRLFIHSNTAPHCCCEECYEQADRADLDDDNPDGLFFDETWQTNLCKDCPRKGFGHTVVLP
jgi:hydrogenase maturation factor HypF (carbamoyltransferase family)